MADTVVAQTPSMPIEIGIKPNGDIVDCVERQERLERTMPRLIYLIVVGVPVLYHLMRNGGVKFDALLLAGIMFAVAKVIIFLVNQLFVTAMRARRYDGAAATLRSRLQNDNQLRVRPFVWTIGAPGALALTPAGEIVVIDRSTNYQPLRIAAHQVADVRVERQAQLITHTRHSGRTIVGGFGNSFGIARTLGGSSTSVTRELEQYYLEIRYQLERNGRVETVIVPGGSERRVVEELCATIKRMEG